VRRFQPGPRFFHPKVSVFFKRNGKKTAIIGSSNLTGGGLSGNFEANVLLDNPGIVQKFQDYLDEHFQEHMRGESISGGSISIGDSGSSEGKLNNTKGSYGRTLVILSSCCSAPLQTRHMGPCLK